MIDALESQIVSLTRGSLGDAPAKISNLIKVIQESSSRISRELKTTEHGVKLAKVLYEIESATATIRGDKRQVHHDLKDLRRLTRRYFAKQSSSNNIRELESVSRRVYHRTLAAWIAKHHVSIQRLGLSQREVEKIAPYLTYLRLNGADEKFVEEILKLARRLKQLKITDSPFTGAAISVLKQPARLQRLVLERCPHFNHPLPQGMSQLRELKIEHCPNYDQPLPMDLTSLQNISIRYVLQQMKELPDELEYALESDDEIEEYLKPFPHLEFLAPIYLIDRQRALDLAAHFEKMELTLLMYVFRVTPSLPQVDIQAVIQKIPNSQIRRLIYEIIVWSEIRKLESYPQEMLVALLRTEEGKAVILEHRSRYLEKSPMQKILHEVYPPGLPENDWLYHKSAEVKESFD